VLCPPNAIGLDKHGAFFVWKRQREPESGAVSRRCALALSGEAGPVAFELTELFLMARRRTLTAAPRGGFAAAFQDPRIRAGLGRCRRDDTRLVPCAVCAPQRSAERRIAFAGDEGYNCNDCRWGARVAGMPGTDYQRSSVVLSAEQRAAGDHPLVMMRATGDATPGVTPSFSHQAPA